MSVITATRFKKQSGNISIRSEISQNPLPIPTHDCVESILDHPLQFLLGL